MILIIDNYDSFSYNLVQLLGELHPDIYVARNDELTVEDIRALAPSHLVLSPGPGKPSEAGRCEEFITAFQGELPILGVCLGHQAICEVYGATVTYAKSLQHGKQSEISIDTDCPLFRGLTSRTLVARYHSLAAQEDTIPPCLLVTAITDQDEIMAVAHRTYPTFGLQFHPESILTPQGKQILQNFLQTTTKGGTL